MIKMVVGIDCPGYPAAAQALTVFPDIARAIAGINQQGVSLLSRKQVGEIPVGQDLPGIRRDFLRAVIGNAHWYAHPLFILQQDVVLAGKIDCFPAGHDASVPFSRLIAASASISAAPGANGEFCASYMQRSYTLRSPIYFAPPFTSVTISVC